MCVGGVYDSGQRVWLVENLQNLSEAGMTAFVLLKSTSLTLLERCGKL